MEKTPKVKEDIVVTILKIMVLICTVILVMFAWQGVIDGQIFMPLVTFTSVICWITFSIEGPRKIFFTDIFFKGDEERCKYALLRLAAVNFVIVSLITLIPMIKEFLVYEN